MVRGEDAEYNVTPTGAALMSRVQRTVDADTGVKAADLPELQLFIRERAQLLLEEIDNWMAQVDCADSHNNKEKVRTGVGVFHYIEEDDDYNDIL